MGSLAEVIRAVLSAHPERIHWDEYFMSLALLISSRSPSERLKVGSVIVRDNRVISSGYNGFPAGAPHTSIMLDGHEINTIHSEQNAISDAAKRGVAIDGSTIYITHFPCIHCAKYIISSGIRSIIYLDDYRNSDIVMELFLQSNVSCVKMGDIHHISIVKRE
jgi:dCMP deaminase